MLSLYVDKKNIKLQQMIPKIIQLSSSYNNTFVFSYVIIPDQKEGIIHMDAEGKFLFNHKFSYVIKNFQMINDRQIIVMNFFKNRIDLVNLQTQSVRYINHQFHFQDVLDRSIEMEVFAETKYFVIIEKGRYNAYNFFATYYRYEDTLRPQICKPLYVFKSKQNQWTHEHSIQKGNSHSMILWFKPQQNEYISISYVDLRNPFQTGFKNIKFKNTGGEPYGISNFSLTIRNIWETKKNTYMLIGQCSSKKQNHQYKAEVVHNNYIYDLTEDKMREVQFHFIDADNVCWNDQIINIFNLGNYSVFYTQNFQKYSAKKSPVYYVNNLTEEIVGQQLQKARWYQIKYFIPGFLSNTIIQSKWDYCSIREVEVSIKRILNQHQLVIVRLPQEIYNHYVHFMMHINSDFDDDLVKDAILLLHQDEHL